jgi:hypothetical protein
MKKKRVGDVGKKRLQQKYLPQSKCLLFRAINESFGIVNHESVWPLSTTTETIAPLRIMQHIPAQEIKVRERIT